MRCGYELGRLAEAFEEGQSHHRTADPVMMMMMMKVGCLSY
jgi:hypothetical protein